MAVIAHPRLDPQQFVALQTSAGWTLAAELIDGEAVVIPPTGGRAASAQGELFFALRGWQRDGGDSGLLLQDVFVALPDGQFVAPDVAWWAAERRPRLGDGAIDAVPDLVVEVLSPATRANDLGVKRNLYLSAAVRELWLADPSAATVTVAVAGDRRDDLVTGGALSSDLLPGFAVELAGVFGG